MNHRLSKWHVKSIEQTLERDGQALLRIAKSGIVVTHPTFYSVKLKYPGNYPSVVKKALRTKAAK